MKNNNIIRTATAGAALAVVFAIAIAVAPAQAHATSTTIVNASCLRGCTGTATVSGSSSNTSVNNSCLRGCRGTVYSIPAVSFPSDNGYTGSYPSASNSYVAYNYNNYKSDPYYYQDRNTYTYPTPYPQPQPYPQPAPQPTYYPLTVSCYSNQSSVTAGQSVTWTAYASGGSGAYTYSWSGTNQNGTGQTAYSSYNTPGSYSASVTVYSNGQTVTQNCGYVTVTQSYSYYYPQQQYSYGYQTYVQPTNTGGLVAACFADRTNAVRGQTVTWAVEVTGGTGQYTYAWSGTDSLSGTGLSVQKAYETLGSKNASVLITSTDGQTMSQACGDAVQIRSANAPAPAPTQPTNVSNSANLSASAFGLGNLPWGWIAILLIIILMVTVFYLLFNRHKAQ